MGAGGRETGGRVIGGGGMNRTLTVGPHGIDVLEAMMTMEPLAGGAGGGM
jgi:hypothetical protein